MRMPIPSPLTRAIAVLAMSATTLTACGAHTVKQSQATLDGTDVHAQQLFDARAARLNNSITGAVVTDVPYVDVRPVQSKPRYPASFRRTVTLNEPLGVAMPVLARRLESMLGIQVEYQAELTDRSNENGSSFAPPPPISRDAVNLPPLELLLGTPPKTSIPIAYTGSAVGLFDTIASATESWWRYEPNTQTVQFYRYMVESFRIPAVQGESSSSAKMGGINNSGGSSGGQEGQMLSSASAEGNHNTDGSIWKDIEDTLKTLVSEDGDFTSNPVLGTITVRDRPDRMTQIRRWLDETANAMARQVDVEMTIYRVTTRDDDARGVNLFAAFKHTADKYGLMLNGTSGPVDTGSSMLGLIVDGDSRFNGSQIIFEALSSLGQTSVEQSASVMTANNQPAPFKVVRRISYLRQVSQGVSSGGLGGGTVNTGPTLTPGTIETGLNMYVVPHVQSDGKRLRMKMMASISSLERMSQVGTTENFIQTPETASREFQNEVWINSGETVVLASFHQTDSGLNSRSPLKARWWGAGGSRNASHGREIMVIAIRPVVSAARSRI